MPKDFSRTRRVAEQLKRELSTLMREELQDPVLRLASLTEVKVTRDMGHASIYVSSLDMQGEGADKAAAVLQEAAGMLRQRLGKMLRLRSIPQLHFLADHLQEDAEHMDRLIEQAVASDRPQQSDESSQ
ncbi:MAG: 30S ribosome-binding factor RbfA [Salinisphaeraceae bacterium]|nr:30S ribosome-binding factor RbfA [Salinisphaeraceae bacterium]